MFFPTMTMLVIKYGIPVMLCVFLLAVLFVFFVEKEKRGFHPKNSELLLTLLFETVSLRCSNEALEVRLHDCITEAAEVTGWK